MYYFIYVMSGFSGSSIMISNILPNPAYTKIDHSIQ